MMNIDQHLPNPAEASKRGEKLDPAHKQKLQKAVREFESVFVGYMLKSMRKTVEKTDNSTDNFGGDMLEGMFDLELAKHVSKNSNLGLAEMLYRKMTGENLSPEKSEEVPDLLKYLKQREESRKVPQGNASLDERLKNYDAYVAEASQKFGVKDSLIRAVIASESSARPDALSAKNAKGLMQLIDSTASDMGVQNVWDPRQNILGGAKYLKQLLEQFNGDESLAVASYNAGPGAVQKHGGIPPYKETREYVSRVMNYLKSFEQQGGDNE